MEPAYRTFPLQQAKGSRQHQQLPPRLGQMYSGHQVCILAPVKAHCSLCGSYSGKTIKNKIGLIKVGFRAGSDAVGATKTYGSGAGDELKYRALGPF